VSIDRSFAYWGASTDVPTGRLGVRFLVEGSFGRSGDHLRITAQLIEPSEKWGISLSVFHGRKNAMPIMSKETRADRLKRLLDAAEDGKIARTEYLSAAQATLAKTARLKALRLAKEAADQKAVAKAKRAAAKEKVRKK
jgi:hypothetical protein